MRPAFLFLAAAMLLPATARAAEPGKKLDTPATEASVQEQKVAPEAQLSDSALEAIIIQHGFRANPYQNPGPHMISDAWSQRT